MKHRIENIVRNCLREIIDKRNKIETSITNELIPHCDYVDETIRNFFSNSLYESKSLFNGYKLLIGTIINYVNQFINDKQPIIQNGYKTWEIYISEKIFSNLDELFFNKLNLKILLIKINNNDNAINFINGKYNTDIEIKNNKIEQLNILLQCPFQNNIKEHLVGEILHEFTHAYQDLFLHSKNAMTNKEYADNIYDKYIEYTNSNNECKRLIGNIFYYLSKTEQNAYVAQMYGDLSTLNYDFIKNNKLIVILRNLKTWQEFIRIREQLDILLERYVKKRNTTNNVMKYVNELCYHKKFKNNYDAYRWLVWQYNLTERRIVKKLGNIVKQYLIDNYNSDRHFIKPNNSFNLY